MFVFFIEKVLKSYHSVPAFLASQGATGSTNDGSDHPYAKVGDSGIFKCIYICCISEFINFKINDSSNSILK